MFDASVDWQNIVRGVILAAAVSFDYDLHGRKTLCGAMKVTDEFERHEAARKYCAQNEIAAIDAAISRHITGIHAWP